MEFDKSLKNEKKEDTDNDSDNESVSSVEMGSTIRSEKQDSEDSEDSEAREDKEDKEEQEQQQGNNIFQTIGKWLLAFFMGILSGLFGFIKSNWIILTILLVIIFAIYFVYSNAVNFLSSFTDILKTIQPLIASTSAMLDSTSNKKTDSNKTINKDKDNDTDNDTDKQTSNKKRIDSLSKTDTDKPSLETTLKAPVESEYKNLDDDVTSIIEDIPDSKVFVADNLVDSQDGDANRSKTGVEGYCFIGSDNGIRTCAPINKTDKCMSGDIFPTLAICMDPKLRE